MSTWGRVSASSTGDRVRVVFLVAAFTALGWLLLTRYSGSSRFDFHRQLLRDFFRAAAARDSTRLRTLVSSDQPLRWALSLAARDQGALPDPDGTIDVRGASRSPGAEDIVVWASGVCADRPYYVTLVGEGRNRRIDNVQSKCTGGK